MSSLYPAIFTIGTLASFLWLGFFKPSPRDPSQDSRLSNPRTEHIDAALVALFLGLVGARAGFVYLHREYYTSNPVEMLWFWQGGMTWSSGALAAILGIGLYAFRSGFSFWSLIDALAIPTGMIAASAWSGCYLDGCAYGIQMPESLWTPVVEDMFGGYNSRWPTQFVGILSSVFIVVSLHLLSNRHLKRGVLGSLSLAMIAAAALALSFRRADPSLLIHGIRLDTLGSALVLLMAFLGLVYCILKKDERTEHTTTPLPSQ